MLVYSIFHPVKVKEWKTNGCSRWVVDGRQNGKRKRIQFDTKTQAETWLKAENKDTTQSAWWLDLKNGERADIMNAFERSREMGFSLLDAVHYYGVQGRGKTFLKKMSLKEAGGRSWRRQAIQGLQPGRIKAIRVSGG